MRRTITMFVLAGALLFTLVSLPGCKGTQNEDIAPEALPAKVRAGFDKAYPGARIKEAEKETYSDGVVHYEIEFVDKNGKSRDVEFNEDGEELPEH